MTRDLRAAHRRARRRTLRGYTPLVVGLGLVAAMVVVVPSRVPDEIANAGDIAAAEVPTGQTASGWGEGVAPCPDRERQVDTDGYAPPCFRWDGGDNGGATSRGVTEDEITVSYRLTQDPNALALIAQLAGMPIDETNEDLLRTAEGLIDYFNQNFQFYGRRLVLEGYEGRGSLVEELYGAGQEAATNDALRVVDEIGAFADVTALTQPYADALARNQVLSFGVPYMSQEWFNDRRPYAWSSTPDCTNVSQMASQFANQHLMGRPARWAGGDLAGRPRKLAIIAPNNLEYQQCVDAGLEVLEEAGNRIALRRDYVLDLGQTDAQAPALVAALKANEITSVSFAGDPLMLMALTREAEAQDYHPEWLVIGVGFVDTDLAGQMISAGAPNQWRRAFGGSPLAAQASPGTSPAYRAYRSVRDDEPSLLVDIVYHQLLPLALGVQMAGPELTPETFETGLFAYPGGTGMAGTWDWRPGNYTPVVDIREIWWDPDRPSPFNGAPGTYVDNGERYRLDEIPEGEPEVFQ
ncbi:MAG TPA: hypothetical protein VIL48_13765 [Acidimicrobiales bacterium]